MDRTFDLKRDLRDRVFIAAHRGAAGGNIVCNTADSYKAALYQGADMLEIDISRSRDGKLFVFHPTMEPVMLRSERLIADMDAAEVDQLFLVNGDATPTDRHVMHFDDFCEMFKGRCYLNIDKFWMFMPEITETIRRHGMQEQVLVKTPAEEKYYDMVEQIAPDLPFMTIAREKDEISAGLLKRKMRYMGIEALFTTDDADICSPEYIDWMHRNGLLVWGNAIVYSYKAVLAAGHSDDVSIIGQPEKGWGWLVDRGFDIIQTDWTLALRQYLESTNRRFKW